VPPFRGAIFEEESVHNKSRSDVDDVLLEAPNAKAQPLPKAEAQQTL